MALPDTLSEQRRAGPRGRRHARSIRRFIGSCANGTLDDLEIAARVLTGRRVAPGVRLLVTPGSQEVYARRCRPATSQTLLEAGAVVTKPTCGACGGGHMGVLGAGETCITASTRNFKGRMGDPSARIYMASPATVAASADHRRHHPSRRIPEGAAVMIAGRVWKFGDNINIELMLPQAALYLPDKERSRYVFQANRPGWVDQVRAGDFIVGGRNYGIGSSRPAPLLAAQCRHRLPDRRIRRRMYSSATPSISVCSPCNARAFTRPSPKARPPRCRPTISPSATARPASCFRPSDFPKNLVALMLDGGVFPQLEREGLIAPAH